MPLPPGLATVTISGRATRPGQGGTLQPLIGRITFTPDVPQIIDTGDNTQIVGAVYAETNANGDYSATLLAPDATGISPTGWTYKVEQAFIGMPPLTPFHIALTKNTPAVNMADLLPVSPISGGTVTGGTVNGDLHITGKLTVGGEALVQAIGHANSHKSGGSDPLTAADIGAEAAGTATTAVTNHVNATDPHGDRAWATGQFFNKNSGGTVNGNVNINGTLTPTGLVIPSGLITTEKSAVFPAPTAAVSYVVWRAAKPVTVTAVRAYRSGGTGVTVNASKNGTADLLAVDLSLSTDTTWMSGASVQNASFAAGDFLVMKITSVTGTPSYVTIQVDVQAA
jgi:hypothetical protein